MQPSLPNDPGPEVRTEPADRPRLAGDSDWGAAAFVWGAWGVLLLAVLYTVRVYASKIPYAEDWTFVKTLTGAQPLTLDYFWEQNNEHRHPLTRAVLWAVLRLARLDFRAPSLFCTLLLGGLAAAMIRVVRRLRGRTLYADAFLPLTLLGVAYVDHNFFYDNCIFYLLQGFAAAVVLLIAAQRGTRLTLGAQVLAGAGLLLLPLCSSGGLLYVPALLGWLWYSAWVGFRSPADARPYRGLVTAAVISAAILVVLYFYFRDFEQTWGTRSRPTVGALLANGLTFMACNFPSDDPWASFADYVMLVLLVLSVVALAAAVYRGTEVTRSRALGLLFFLGALGTLTLGLSWGRGADAKVYGLLAVFVPCWFYLVWTVCWPHTLGRFVQACLFTWMVVAFPLHVQDTLYYERERKAKRQAFLADLEAGLPPYRLLPRHKETIAPYWGDHGWLAEGMSLLHQAGVGPFRDLQENPPFREVPFPLEWVTVNEMTWERGTTPPSWWPARPAEEGDATAWVQCIGHVTGPESYLTIDLGEPTFVAGIRIASSQVAGFASRVGWRKVGAGDFPAQPQFASSVYSYGPVIFIGETIDGIRIQPQSPGPFDFDILEIVLLLPEGEP